MWFKLCVLVRFIVLDKFILVKGMMESYIKFVGEIVVVIGLGVNDGFVLRMVDVGFIMVSFIIIIVFLKVFYMKNNN